MAKLAPTSIKYIIKAKIAAKGVIEKPDVIGAVFGQTEGLLGSELDLRELQQTGRIGRIEVNIKSSGGNSEGEIIIPSSLDASETSLIAATLETIERVGPCNATIKLLSVEDTRSDKRKYVVDKAKDILRGLMDSGEGSGMTEVSEQIKESVREGSITTFNGLPAGPDALDSDEIVIVEGRADVINLLKYGVTNAVAIGGTAVPKAIGDIAKEKIVTVFVDGDRGGQLIVKELLQMADLDYVAVAPENKEVEELSKKEIHKALRDKMTVEQYKKKFSIVGGHQKLTEFKSRDSGRDSRGPPRSGGRSFSRDSRGPPRSSGRSFDRDSRGPPRSGGRFGGSSRGSFSRDSRGPPRSGGRFGDRRSGPRSGGRFGDRPIRRPRMKPGEKAIFKGFLDEVAGSKIAKILNENDEVMGQVPVAELENTLKTLEKPYAVVLDGKITANLSFTAKVRGVKFLIGMEKDQIESSVAIFDKKDLERGLKA